MSILGYLLPMMPHSPDEKVEIASVGKFYEFMVDTLRNIPKK